MSKLSDLKSELAQQEVRINFWSSNLGKNNVASSNTRLFRNLLFAKGKFFSQEANKALEMIKNQEAQKIKVEAEKLDTSEEVQDDKSQVKRRGKERKKAVKSTEKLQGTTNQSKSTRSRLADGKADSQTSLQDERANTKETLKTKPKSRAAAVKPTESVKTTRGPQKKVERESNPHESEQAGRERRKPAERAQTSAPRPKKQSQVKTADGGEEAPNCGLRRSKRIASRR